MATCLVVFAPRLSAAIGSLPLGWSDAPGHVSYVLIAVSYWLTDIYWLRVTAVVGLFFEILYFRSSGGNMHTGIAWDVVFIAINLYQTYRLVSATCALARFPDVHLLKKGVLSVPDDGQLTRLIPSGRWKTFETGAVLVREGKDVNELALVCEGEAEALSAGKTLRALPGVLLSARWPIPPVTAPRQP